MSIQLSEMSKTYQYRKVMKPMLERKRRARINKCLDELKDLMVATLESEGEHVTRLEKADILELTVSHLQKMKEQCHLIKGSKNTAMSHAEGFRSGYIHAVNEVSRSLSELPGTNINLGTKLMTHLGQRLNQLQPPVKPAIPLNAPLSLHINGNNYSQRSQSHHHSHPHQSSHHSHHHHPYHSVSISPVSGYASSPDSSHHHSHQHHEQHHKILPQNNNHSLLTTCYPSGPIDNNKVKTDDATARPIDQKTMLMMTVKHERERNEENASSKGQVACADEEDNVWRPW